MLTTETFTVTREVELSYDPDSPEFKEALAGYIECMDSDATAETMLKAVAGTLTSWGDHEHMVEGVGFVAVEGHELPAENYSGITIGKDYDWQEID